MSNSNGLDVTKEAKKYFECSLFNFWHHLLSPVFLTIIIAYVLIFERENYLILICCIQIMMVILKHISAAGKSISKVKKF